MWAILSWLQGVNLLWLCNYKILNFFYTFYTLADDNPVYLSR